MFCRVLITIYVCVTMHCSDLSTIRFERKKNNTIDNTACRSWPKKGCRSVQKRRVNPSPSKGSKIPQRRPSHLLRHFFASTQFHFRTEHLFSREQRNSCNIEDTNKKDHSVRHPLEKKEGDEWQSRQILSAPGCAPPLFVESVANIVWFHPHVQASPGVGIYYLNS